MKVIKFAFWILIGAAVWHLGLAIFAASCAHADPVIAGAWQPVTAAPPGDALGFEGKLAAWSVVLYTLGRLVLEVLKVRAPQTETKWDDYARDALARALGERVSPPAPAAVVAVVQPPPRDPQVGIARTLLLVVLSGLVIGGAIGAGAVGCAASKRVAGAAGHAVIDCAKQDAPAIIAGVAHFGARAVIDGRIDWDAIETAAKGAGLGVGSCAVAAFLQALKQQPSTQVAARGGPPDVIAQGQAVLARVSGGAEVLLAGAAP